MNVETALTRLGLTRLRLGSFGTVPLPEPVPVPLPGPELPFRWCRSCDVKWRGSRVCRCCGKATG